MWSLLARLTRRVRSMTGVAGNPFSAAFSADFGAGSGVQPSPDRTVVLAGTGGMIVDAAINKWTITSGAQVALNGVADRTTRSVVEIAYVGGRIWQKTTAGLWWWRTAASGWQPPQGTKVSPLAKIPPSQVTGLKATAVTPTSVTLTWRAPATGTAPFTYAVMSKAHGSSNWIAAPHTQKTTTTLTNLMPGTTYSIEVVAANN